MSTLSLHHPFTCAVNGLHISPSGSWISTIQSHLRRSHSLHMPQPLQLFDLFNCATFQTCPFKPNLSPHLLFFDLIILFNFIPRMIHIHFISIASSSFCSSTLVSLLSHSWHSKIAIAQIFTPTRLYLHPSILKLLRSRLSTGCTSSIVQKQFFLCFKCYFFFSDVDCSWPS